MLWFYSILCSHFMLKLLKLKLFLKFQENYVTNFKKIMLKISENFVENFRKSLLKISENFVENA